MAAGPREQGEGPCLQEIYLTDYTTGSTYEGTLTYCFTGTPLPITFHETSPGGYSFNANLWKTSDGSHNVDFLGNLDAGHGFCCGSLPCNLTA